MKVINISAQPINPDHGTGLSLPPVNNFSDIFRGCGKKPVPLKEIMLKHYDCSCKLYNKNKMVR